jgi:uncharacterized protein (DUF2252 family)
MFTTRARLPSRLLATASLAAVTLAARTSALAAQSRSSVVVTEITSANAQLPAAIRAEKLGLMRASPLAFFRGSNHLFWKDFGNSPQLATYGGASSTRTWLSGDAHTDNLGSFDDDQGDVVYALNDFDESVLGDYQLDVWRLAVSVVLVARENGFGTTDQAALVDSFTEAYLDAMASYAGSSSEATLKFVAGNTYGLLDDFLADVASSNSRTKMLDAWTVMAGGVRTLDVAHNPDLAPVSAPADSDVRNHMSAYRSTLSGSTTFPASYFTVKSVAQRLHAGLGSLGATRYYVLIEGPSSSQSDDRILDMKAQRTPTAWSYLAPSAVSQTSAACGGNMALRTVLAYKALGYRVDDLLGWTSLSDGATYSVRERSPFKGTFDTATLTSTTRLTNLAEQWGTILATQHARADKDWNSSVLPGSIDGQVNALTNGDHAGFRVKVRALAMDYADQVALDYASFQANF